MRARENICGVSMIQRFSRETDSVVIPSGDERLSVSVTRRARAAAPVFWAASNVAVIL